MMVLRIWRLSLPLWLALGSLLLGGGVFFSLGQVSAQETLSSPQISLAMLVGGLTQPVHITHAGDGSGRIFVVERAGRIRIIKNGVLIATPFLDITDRVRTVHSEEGLLSVAFPPNYDSNTGHFYVYYTNLASNLVIARYFLTSADVADPTSEEFILTINHPGEGNHNGGQLAFGPNDGYLYIGTGDGGSGGDPPNNAQNTNSLLGKMLRIDVETGNPVTYTIPASNPFTQTSALDEIWALGLRNPWRYSFDQATGDQYIGDVGQGSWEEISYQAANTPGGVNFGWRCREGAHDFNFSGNCGSLTLTDPIAEYPNSGPDIAVTGGFVYRGTQSPPLVGYYFFADFGSGKIWSMRKTGSNPDTFSTPELQLDTALGISTFGEDEAGNVYLADYSSGEIYQIIGPGADLSSSTKTVSPAFGDPGETFSYTITLINTGDLLTQSIFLTDTLPTGLGYVPNTLTADFGAVDDTGPDLLWNGLMNPTSTVQITYQVTATGIATGSLQNSALVNAQNAGTFTLTTKVLISPEKLYLPIIIKN